MVDNGGVERYEDNRLTYADLAGGDRFEADEAVAFTRNAIVHFASVCDPQPFHPGKTVVGSAPLDGLVAGGLRSFCECSHLATGAFLERVAFLGGTVVGDLLGSGRLPPA
ncbi:MAG: hypothetical protein ABEI27_01365 [Halobellus sp.]|uniref:hypothetical protein n=1 Tax=Halobellus sp. TaxID=1979212 RepID=UPI0035D42170